MIFLVQKWIFTPAAVTAPLASAVLVMYLGSVDCVDLNFSLATHISVHIESFEGITTT